MRATIALDGLCDPVRGFGQGNLKGLSFRQRATVIEAIERDLTHRPVHETRNRKLLRPNLLAPWELRIGEMRGFYDVTDNQDPAVTILAIGLKWGNRLMLARTVIQL